MGWILAMVVAVVLLAVMLWVASQLKRNEDKEFRTAGKVVKIVALVAFVLFVSLFTVTNSVHEVPAGHVGVLYRFGSIKGQVSEGLQWIPPWCKLDVANIQIQRHVFAGTSQLVSFSQETQTVYVQASLNIRVTPQAIQELYRSVGPSYFDTLVTSRVSQNFKDEIVKYKSVEIAPNREKIRNSVSERLERELAPYSIEVVTLLLDNVDFRPEFEAAIEAKQIATQKSLEEEQKVVVERHKAEQALERARGEGNALLAIAEKQAEANSKLSASLTPALVQYAMIQKLSDKIQVIMIPSGQNFILDSGVLKPKTESEHNEKK